MSTTRTQAIAIAKQEVATGYALRYLSDDEGVHVETDQGWMRIWTDDDDDIWFDD